MLVTRSRFQSFFQSHTPIHTCIHSLINELDRALHSRERDVAKVLASLPELDVLRAVLALAELLEVVPPRDVVEEVREGAGPALQLPHTRVLHTGGGGEGGGGRREGREKREGREGRGGETEGWGVERQERGMGKVDFKRQ